MHGHIFVFLGDQVEGSTKYRSLNSQATNNCTKPNLPKAYHFQEHLEEIHKRRALTEMCKIHHKTRMILKFFGLLQEEWGRF